jgi:hypothetical protein
MKYVGQTGRPFRARFQEHFCDYGYPNNKSKFARHLLENSTSIGPIENICPTRKYSIDPIENIMDVLYTANKGRLMDTMERLYIYKEIRLNNQINDKTPSNLI